jgi:alanine racemase
MTMTIAYQHRPTHAVIRLDRYRANLRAIQKHVGRERQVIAVVKAKGYGHGMVECARAAVKEGIKWLAVATVDEALTLRATRGLASKRILVLGPTFPSDAEELVNNKIDVAVGSLPVMKALDKAGEKFNTRARVHLKTDTGMGRFGFWCEDVPELVKEFKKLSHLNWQAMMTHFSESDIPSYKYTKWQTRNFEKLVKECSSLGFRPPLLHAANSGAILQHPAAWYDMVRPGIMSYGLLPDPLCKRTVKLRPVMNLMTRIIEVRAFPKGRFLSYGRTYETKRKTRVGILPMGYGDGYPRLLSNKGYVMVCGKKAPVIGRVCMDQVLIDITRIPQAGIGSEVVVWGKKGRNIVPLEELSSMIGTITYELTCQVTPRVPREYLDNS